MQTMTIKKIIRTVFLFAFLLWTAKSSVAQLRAYDTVTTNIMNEIEVLQNVLYSTPYISFNATYYMNDIDTVSIRDTITAVYKLNGNKMYLLMLKDTIENIQNDNFFASVYHTNKTLIVKKPVSLAKQVFQLDVMDTLFQSLALAGMTASDSSGFRKITMSFDSGSIFKSYQMVYNKFTSQLLYLTYSLRKDTNPASTSSVNMTIVFSNYEVGQFTDAVFSTDPFFIIKSASTIILAPGMDPDYELVNMIAPDASNN